MTKESYEAEFEIFGYNVAWLRKRYGLSKKEMAEIMGIGVGSLTKVERGEIPPQMKVDVLVKIYRRFGITPERQLRQRLGTEDCPGAQKEKDGP